MGYQMRRGAAPKFRELGSSETQPGDSPNKNALQGAAQGAKLGAALGTVVPGLGNVAGGIIGGLGGLVMGSIKAKKEKIAAIRQAKLRLSNIKIEEITQIFRGKSKQIKH